MVLLATVPEIQRPLQCVFELEQADAACGQPGGWFLLEALVPGVAYLTRREFVPALGLAALHRIEHEAEDASRNASA
jgi:hypothetical protein